VLEKDTAMKKQKLNKRTESSKKTWTRLCETQVASAKNVELLEAYANTVLAALRDVEDGLSGVTLTAKQYAALNESRNRAQRLAVMSAKVVERGGMDFVQLYEIQRTVLAAEDSAISARNDQLRASVDLYKAIGGGLKLENDPCLGGGGLPKADERWTANAKKADSVLGDKPAIGMTAKGQAAYEGKPMQPLPNQGIDALQNPLTPMTTAPVSK
jgi:hypothetical protein